MTGAIIMDTKPPQRKRVQNQYLTRPNIINTEPTSITGKRCKNLPAEYNVGPGKVTKFRFSKKKQNNLLPITFWWVMKRAPESMGQRI